MAMTVDVTGYLAHIEARSYGKRQTSLMLAVKALVTGEHLHVVSPDGTWCSGTCEAQGSLIKPMPADADFRRGLAGLLRPITPASS